ncbi:hypothetical protein [Amylibacter sp. IMCC11727]|uniref:hypothetical protein n=1 Tax=Amylibacter sp. IMCC11727 TaxID=3039851 RepID=UPI00244E2651|nr:hypothetical protein [Amylibacter sp. IMCC11727]WGI20891.1 hypothetical protein QBD29_12315 [Amylibacter sp. IMCC11727]
MKTFFMTTATTILIATGAMANTTIDRVELELIRSGQIELAGQYDSLSENEKRKLVNNSDPWVRQATREWIKSLYD